ncbi:MAG TPA: hypothetical protein VJ065_00390 [Patescibacteria group bacterium]|nr:hypothetical protein [Patescibacteria group bacterium]
MRKNLGAFKIKVGTKILDYRLGENLNLDDVKKFSSRKYKVKKLWQGPRHVLGELEKSDKNLFLKLSTTEGIGAVTKNEYNWNEEFNSQIQRPSSTYWVPKNYDCGFYKNKLFYLITDKLEGEFLAKEPVKSKISQTFIASLPKVIAFSQLIQSLKVKNRGQRGGHHEIFLNKTKSWLTDIPYPIQNKYALKELYKIVEGNTEYLKAKQKHGDFTPWHIIKLESGQLALIDGEHALKNGVELYDIGYFVQRVFSVLKNPKLAGDILNLLRDKGLDIQKLRCILAARAIGGFLDESLAPAPDYSYADNFRKWISTI